MRSSPLLQAALPAVTLIGFVAVVWAQRPFREYPAMEGYASEAPLEADHLDPSEFILGRLMYPSRGGGFGRGGGGGSWTVDYPKGDRFFAKIIRRLTRINVRSAEQPVDPDDGDDIYYWPYLHVGMPSSWNLTNAEADKIRDYLMRGGFLICDSFFGTTEWEGFLVGMEKIFPDRPIEEISDDDPIFHTVFNLKERIQVGNYRSLMRDPQRPYRGDGAVPHWYAIRDDEKRIVVVMNFNNDLGDSWQNADIPSYPQKYSDMGIRLGINYVIYTMTH